MHAGAASPGPAIRGSGRLHGTGPCEAGAAAFAVAQGRLLRGGVRAARVFRRGRGVLRRAHLRCAWAAGLRRRVLRVHPGRTGPARGAGAAEASQLKPQKPWPQRLLQPRLACRKSCAFAPSCLRTGPAAPFAAHGGLRRSLRSTRLGTGPAGRRGVILNEKGASAR